MAGFRGHTRRMVPVQAVARQEQWANARQLLAWVKTA